MKYKIPLYASFAFSAIGAGLFYFSYPVTAQVFFVLAFVMGIGAFKMRGGIESTIVHFVPAAILAYVYYVPGVFPFLSIAIILSAIQNPFLELFFPSKMYNTPTFKIIIAVVALSLYLTANIVYPTSTQAWVFPGLFLLFADLLSMIVVMDLVKLAKISGKGYIKIGSVCPDFSLPDETGNLISSKDFKGKYLLLIFVRGDWCPGCHIMLRCYERNREKFAERGVNMLSIGPDPLGVNKEMVKKLGLHYHILSDERQLVAKQFCVELQEMAAGVPEYNFIPLPASFLIDKKGMVRYTSRADKAGEILNPEHIFQILGSLN
ncbi:MAG TPA: peroxiredoxin family protein [Bacteroidia bacterium]|jgi:peroxiredoxin Q/BCP|nr:peroxiredoxin family protein [Bacteroidia bacterium]